jgi:hypothetical protein
MAKVKGRITDLTDSAMRLQPGGPPGRLAGPEQRQGVRLRPGGLPAYSGTRENQNF